MERASDVNNVADRTETPSGKSSNERATFNDVADRTETPSSVKALKKTTYESYVKDRAAYRSAINESPEICTIVHKVLRPNLQLVL